MLFIDICNNCCLKHFCRGLLCDVVLMKIKIFEMSKTRAQSAEEYLKVTTLVSKCQLEIALVIKLARNEKF